MNARLLDWHRFDMLMGRGSPDRLLSAVDAYRNPDGGYGWGLEPDFRSATSQPGGALHAFEVFDDIAPLTSPRAVELCDWLASVTRPDGGLPFALPFDDTTGTASWWSDQAGLDESSLQITSIVAAVAHHVARHDRAVAGHPWLERATTYCIDTIGDVDEPLHAIVLNFSLHFLDAVHDSQPRAAELMARLGQQVPAGGSIPVEGGTADEAIHPLDIAPAPDRPVRSLFSQQAIDTGLDRLESEQCDDGGWPCHYAKFSPSGALEWRGHLTVNAVSILRANGRA